MKKRNLLLILLLAIAAFCTFQLIDCSSLDDSPVENTSEKIQRQADLSDSIYQAQFESLQQRNDSLQQVISSTRMALNVARKKTVAAQKQVLQLAGKVKTETDTVTKLALCDSLQAEVVDLSVASSERDSLCEKTITELTGLLANKDTTLALCQRNYSGMSSLLDQSIGAQHALEKALKKVEKKLKRRARWNRVLSAGALVLSGVVTAKILQSNPL